MPLRDMNREQMWLLPPTLDDLLSPDHPARFVAEFVDGLDRQGWGEIDVEIDRDLLGAPAYHPRALLCVWLYGFMSGVRSSRKLEAACRDQIPFLWLTGCQHPDHNTLWRFYQRHRQGMRELFRRTVRTAVALDLVDLAYRPWMELIWRPTQRWTGRTREKNWAGCWSDWTRRLRILKPRTRVGKTVFRHVSRSSWPAERRCGNGSGKPWKSCLADTVPVAPGVPIVST